MSTRYVDPDMVKFGQTVATRLRVISASLRGVAVNVDALNSGLTYIAAAPGPFLAVPALPSIATSLKPGRARGKSSARTPTAAWRSGTPSTRINETFVKLMRERFNLNLEITQ